MANELEPTGDNRRISLAPIKQHLDDIRRGLLQRAVEQGFNLDQVTPTPQQEQLYEALHMMSGSFLDIQSGEISAEDIAILERMYWELRSDLVTTNGKRIHEEKDDISVERGQFDIDLYSDIEDGEEADGYGKFGVWLDEPDETIVFMSLNFSPVNLSFGEKRDDSTGYGMDLTIAFKNPEDPDEENFLRYRSGSMNIRDIGPRDYPIVKFMLEGAIAAGNSSAE